MDIVPIIRTRHQSRPFKKGGFLMPACRQAGEKIMTIVERPALNFDMFTVSRTGIQLAADQVRQAFGEENYYDFIRYGKNGKNIPEELADRVNGEMYRKMELWCFAQNYGGRRLWHEAMKLANSAVNYARGILFPDQDKRGTATVNIAWSDNRPSTALKILTTPTKLMGPQAKFEQGRQLGWAWIGAQVIMADENGESAGRLTSLNDFLESRLFIGRKGDPGKYHTFSYHTPHTNRVEGVSDKYPDPEFAEELWVKELEFPVRTLALRDSSREITERVPVLYDQREKNPEAVVIKAKHKSLRIARLGANGGIIEVTPYMGDKLGFRLVLMEGGEGGRPLRDKVTAYLEKLLETYEGFDRIEEDDQVDPEQGAPDRVPFRRRNLYLQGLRGPVEIQIFALEDWLNQEYEVGQSDPVKGMHDGPAHDLYRLAQVADIAGHTWPRRLYGFNHAAEKKAASDDYADRLGRKQRIYPLPYAA